jgi:hypothetical protein
MKTMATDNETSKLPIYPLWNTRGISTLRFLRDKNEKNDYFWVSQPIPLEGDRKIYLHRVVLLALVVKSLIAEIPDGTVCKIVLSGNDFKKFIQHAIVDVDCFSWPTDYDTGLDFNITVADSGYVNSCWIGRSLSQNERDIAEANLIDLNDLLVADQPKTIKEAEEIRKAKIVDKKSLLCEQINGQHIKNIAISPHPDSFVSIVLANGKTLRITIEDVGYFIKDLKTELI